jgi:protein BUR2
LTSLEQNIAATALFLASKAEENCRKTKEIVIAVAKVAQKNASLIIDEQSKEFWRWKDSILMYEETMLELLTFDVVLKSPYTFLYDFLRELDVESNKPLRNVAWAFLNDNCMTTLCLLMPPRDIAIAAMFFSAKFNKERLPDDENGLPWWIHLKGAPERIFKAIDIMADFYTDNPLKKSDNPYDHNNEDSHEDLERTRLMAESVSPSSRMAAEQAEADEDGHQNGAANGASQENHNKPGLDQSNDDAGDNDAQLKAVANDPATHEATLENGINGLSPKSPLKRKENDDRTEPNAKRVKTENNEDNEEGEVEE